ASSGSAPLPSAPLKPRPQSSQLQNQDQDTSRARRILPPPSPPIEATATKQKNDNYNDKKRGHVHGFSVLSQSLSQGILDPARWALNIAGRILLRPRPARA